MNYLILPHLGLGDQLIMNGFVQYLIHEQKANKILIIAYDNYQRTSLLHLYSDTPVVEFLWIEHPNGRFSPFVTSLNGRQMFSKVELDSTEYILLNFGLHSQYRCASLPNHSWADSFYIQGQLDPAFRFSLFTLPKNMQRAEEIYKNIKDEVGSNYILIHDEPKTNRYINGSLIKNLLKKSKHDELPVIYLGIQRYDYPLIDGLNNINVSDKIRCDSLLDLWYLIQNATECHFMDSSISCMTDLIPDSKSLLNLHAYVTDTVDKEKPIFVNRKWDIFFERE
jgi:hypothetical protein